MQQPETEQDSREFHGRCDSSRPKWSVVVGEDKAHPLIEAVCAGDDAALRSLLAQPRWTETMLDEQSIIHTEDRPLETSDDVRPVHAMPISHLQRSLILGAEHGHAVVVTILLDFAASNNVDFTPIITRLVVGPTITRGHAGVLRALAQAYPAVINVRIAHGGGLPLNEAVRLGQFELVVLLLQFGADPLHPVRPPHQLYSYGSSLMSLAAMCRGPHMVQLLLEYNVPIAGSAALHTAVAHGHLDTAYILLDHGADVNEQLVHWRTWTPLHFAAWRTNTEGMDFLLRCGARPDITDEKGRTAAQVLEESERKRALHSS